MTQTKKSGKRRILRRRGAITLAVAAVMLAGLAFGLWRGSAPNPAAEQQTEPPATSGLPENPFAVQDFSYEDGYMSCSAAETALGVDVSEHQGQIDWQQVRDAGMEFAIIRVGYRGYSQGTIRADSNARVNLEQAREAGLSTGVYFYSQAVTVEEAQEEARWVTDFLGDTQLELPVVYDWEYVDQQARTGTMSGKQVTDCALAFCQAVEAAGYTPMVYFNLDLAGRLLDLEALQPYGFWLAQYEDALTFPYAVTMWQYTNQGKVNGISENVDLNLLFLEAFSPKDREYLNDEAQKPENLLTQHFKLCIM